MTTSPISEMRAEWRLHGVVPVNLNLVREPPLRTVWRIAMLSKHGSCDSRLLLLKMRYWHSAPQSAGPKARLRAGDLYCHARLFLPSAHTTTLRLTFSFLKIELKTLINNPERL